MGAGRGGKGGHATPLNRQKFPILTIESPEFWSFGASLPYLGYQNMFLTHPKKFLAAPMSIWASVPRLVVTSSLCHWLKSQYVCFSHGMSAKAFGKFGTCVKSQSWLSYEYETYVSNKKQTIAFSLVFSYSISDRVRVCTSEQKWVRVNTSGTSLHEFLSHTSICWWPFCGLLAKLPP